MKGVKKTDTSAYLTAYNQLNSEQKRAVDTIDGPVMVIAGPGTGKTQILTLRIANILLKTDTKPSQVLALTFTDSGARSMRERLVTFIGHAAYDVSIYTFHSFADMIIRRYPEAFPHIIGGRAASSIEQIRIIESALEAGGYAALRPTGDPTYYIKPIQSAIGDLKKEYISPDEFSVRINTQEEHLLGISQFHEKGAHKGKERGEYTKAKKLIDRNRELLTLYRTYESSLSSARLYDFNDMINNVVGALESNTDLLRELQEQYLYVLADEHQDVNGSQNRLLELLVTFHDHPNVFVVGDEKQAIFRFQGASLDNFLYFEPKFGSTVTIALTENYRSGQPILNAAHALVATDDPRLAALRIPLTAAQVTDATITLREFAHEAIETDWLVSSVKESLEHGTPPEEIAVIVRTNREVERFSALLRSAGVSVSPSADSDILEHPVVLSALKLITFFTNPADDVALGEVLMSPYVNLPIGEIASLFAVRLKHPSLASAVESLIAAKTASPALEQFWQALNNARAYATTEAPHRHIERLLDETGFTNHILSTDVIESARVLRRLFDELDGMVRRQEVTTVREVYAQLRLHSTYGIGLNAPYIHASRHAVQVMTAHKSKGLEFDTVLVPRCTDASWGKKTSRTLFNLPIVKHDVGDSDVAEDDERRLLYVAMTRAKHNLHLSYAQETVEGKGQSVSRFIHDISALVTVADTKAAEAAFTPITPSLPLAPSIFAEYMKETMLTRGWSPTTFNNFVKSPWEYFFKNVLRVPQLKSANLQYGSAMHATIDLMIKEKNIEPGFISDTLRRALAKEALSHEELAELHERGLSALTVYREVLAQYDTSESETEVSLEAYLPTLRNDVPHIKITGSLDRVDYKDGIITKVIDYKTGKPKSRNVIEGKTADSDGNYKRQLVFYALLLSLQPDARKHCRTGVLSFIEPNGSGKVKEESFEITDDEMSALTLDLQQATNAILDGTALLALCDDTICDFCHLLPTLKDK